MSATLPYFNRIAVVFDFDHTLAPPTFRMFVSHLGMDPERFERERVRPLIDGGCEHILARFYGLISAARDGECPPITKERLAEAGRNIKPYRGVPEMFGRLREAARAIASDIEVEFYLLTCGLVEMHRNSSFASEFEDAWGSDFLYDGKGEAVFISQLLTFPEKVSYLMQLAKGLGIRGPSGPEDVWRDVPPEKWHVPFDQMIYAGDGGSDMPAFDLMNDEGGIPLAIYDAESAADWKGHAKMRAGRHVENLAPSDYSPDGETMQSLTLAVECVAKRIALRRLGRGE